MNFVSASYAVFFVAVLLTYWRLEQRGRLRLLLFASWYFYACWDYRFLSLIIISTLVDFLCGKRIHLAQTRTTRRRWLACSLTTNLGILAYFKYCNFFIDSMISLLNAGGLTLSPFVLNITLPVGISFYTFQTLSYSIDIYRGQLNPTSSLLDFATFVGFFPQLVAGPIIRAKDFLPQLQSARRFDTQEFQEGLRRFVYGFIKKAFIGDTLAIVLVDPVFKDPGSYGSASLWIGLIGYTVQIYCDFSGYSSMAIGSAKMLGFRFAENFNFPYLAWNFSDFWRRWHITMSSFFRDYVYIPLGGSRVSYRRNLLNLAATTLVSGLWHGASWTFVLWGALHGLYIAASHASLRRLGPNPDFAVKCAGWVLTQLCVMLAWVVFRASDFASASIYLAGLFGRSAGTATVSLSALTLLAFALFVVDHSVRGRVSPLRAQAGWFADAMAHAAMIVLLYHCVPDAVNPFIYFQF